MPLFETISRLFSTGDVPAFSVTPQQQTVVTASERVFINTKPKLLQPHSKPTTRSAHSPKTPHTGGVSVPSKSSHRQLVKHLSTGGVAVAPPPKRSASHPSKKHASSPSKPSTYSSKDYSSDIDKVIRFANEEWLCADPQCRSKVLPGQFQNNYECAEFVARSLAAGGFLPNLKPRAPQVDYEGYPFHGDRYALWNTYGLNDALHALGFQKQPNSPSSVRAGCAVIGDPGDGYFAHACLGVGNGEVTCHNMARHNIPVGDVMVDGINSVMCPRH